MAFEQQVRPTFYQSDPAGVLYYGRIFELFHQAYSALIVASGVPYRQYFTNPEFAAPIVHAEADYRRPIWPGETLTIRVEIPHLGETSIHVAYTVVDAEDTVRARGKEVHACIHLQTFEKAPMPDWLRGALSPYATPEASEPPPG